MRVKTKRATRKEPRKPSNALNMRMIVDSLPEGGELMMKVMKLWKLKRKESIQMLGGARYDARSPWNRSVPIRIIPKEIPITWLGRSP